MICDHPQCTGIHDNGKGGRHAYAEQCPRVQERHRAVNRARQARYAGTAAGMLACLRRNAKKRGTSG